jgi:DNA polymerase-1
MSEAKRYPQGRWVFDIEADNLLHKVTQLWLVLMYNIDTGEMLEFLPGEMGWKEVMDDAKLLVGHNILGYDLPALEKMFGYRPPKSVRMHDTLILSQILNYRRFGFPKHSLEAWGEYLGLPKIDFNDFSKYTPEMLVYCRRDVHLNFKVYEELLDELQQLSEKAPQIKTYLLAEQAAAKWCAKASLHGWPFDVEGAIALKAQFETEMDIAYDALNQILGLKVIPVDKAKGIVPHKMPKWTLAGCYDSHTAKWFGVDPWSGFEGEERIVDGPYSRVLFEPLSLDSVQDVKVFLYRNDWQPTEWNMKRNEDTGKMENTTPKITEDSLEFMGSNGKLYLDFLTTKSRFGILKTWLENIDEDGNLHGDCMLIGTPSMRARHSIIVNVPGADAPWGKEMRKLFACKPGWKLIGCDSAGNQARGLAHYLKNEQFIDTLLNGDIHQYNADALTNVLKGMGIDYVVKRSQAKRILYAFLFGASGGKLWSYIFGTISPKLGNKLKKGFLKAVPGFQELIDKLERIWGSTRKVGDGYIPSIAGNRIYVDSPHKLLVYLLQACEKATCSTALMVTMETFEAEGIPYIPCIYYHDEIDFMVPEEHAERAAEIGKNAFKIGPEKFGITIMDGDAKIGHTWYDVH